MEMPDYTTIVKLGLQKKKVGKRKRNMFTCKLNLAYYTDETWLS